MNIESNFADLSLGSWLTTRDTLWGYTRVLGALRRANEPGQPHWWHITLPTIRTGFTTTEIQAADSTVEIQLDLFNRQARLLRNRNGVRIWALEGQTPDEFLDQVKQALAQSGLVLSSFEVDLANFPGEGWNDEAIGRFWRAFSPIDAALKTFKETLAGRTSPVHLFSHNFDHSLLWFSGRLVPGQDPGDEESAEERMTFGFSTGDRFIAEPYFYATAYPEPAGFVGSELPGPAYWNSGGFSGGVLTYAGFRAAEDPEGLLSDFLRAAHRAGASRMTD